MIIICAIISSTIVAQETKPKIPAGSTLIQYCEFGNKGIKFGVLAFTDKKARSYVVVESSELNIAPGKSVQGNGTLAAKDINSILQSTTEAFNKLNQRYTAYGLKDNNAVYYASSGMALIKNMNEFKDSVKSKSGKGLYIVNVDEEAKYTVAGTVPYEKILVSIVADQGSGNTKGGYVMVEGNELTVQTFSFDLGSTSVYNHILKMIPGGLPDDKDEARLAFISAMNKCFDSLKVEIRSTLENVQNAQNRNELYISGGAAYIITTLLYPEVDQSQQMIEISYDKLKAFMTEIQDKDYYKKLSERTFTDEKVQKNYTKALGIYNYLQLISATKLLTVYVNALSADNKKIFFNTYGLHAMPATLMGRVLRGEIPRW